MADYDLKYTGAQIDGLLDAANELKTNGYIYKGVATPSTNPGTPTERVAYLASEPGTYTNFGGIVITSGLYSLTYVSGTWTGTQMSAGSDIEVVQTTGDSTTDVMSQKAVTDSLVGSIISYDNSESGLAATDVQGALDETHDLIYGTGLVIIDGESNTYTLPKANMHRTTVQVPFIVGKTYKILMTVEQATDSTKYAYLYKTTSSGEPNILLGRIQPNELAATFFYTPSQGTNYTNLGVYATSTYNNTITFVVTEMVGAKNLLSSDIVDNLTDGGSGKVLSAEQGKLLYGMSYEEPKETEAYATYTKTGINADDNDANFGEWMRVSWLQLFYIRTQNIDKLILTVPTYMNDNALKAGTIVSKGGVHRSVYLIPNTGTDGYRTITIDTSDTDYVATSWWYGSSLASKFSCKAVHTSEINKKIDELESTVSVSIPSAIGGKEVVILDDINIASELTEGGKHYIIVSELTSPSAITIGENSVLDFRGGTLNGQYTGNNTRIIAEPVMIFRNAEISGTWQSEAYYCEWFVDSDWAVKAEKCISAFGAVKFVGRYVFTQNIDVKRIASVEFAQGSYVTVSNTFIHPYLFEVYFEPGYFPGTYTPFSYDSVKFYGNGLIDMNGRAGFLRTVNSTYFNTNLTNLRVINFGVCEENTETSHAYVELGSQECYIVNCSFSYKSITEPQQQYGLLLTNWDNKVLRTTIICTNIGISCKGGFFTDVHVWGWPKIGIVSSSYLKMTNCYLDCCAEAIRLNGTSPFMISNLGIIGTSHSACSDGHRYIVVTNNKNVKGLIKGTVQYEANTETYKHFAVRTESGGTETYTEYTPSSANVESLIFDR